MSHEFSNDNSRNEAETIAAADPYGQAALLLVESVLHGLIEQAVFSVAKAVELVDLAAEVRADIGVELGEARPTLAKSLALLGAISSSLQT